MKKGRCVKCGKLTPYAIRYDIDCSPIWTHKKCEEDIKIALTMILLNCDGAKEFTKDWHCPF